MVGDHAWDEAGLELENSIKNRENSYPGFRLSILLLPRLHGYGGDEYPACVNEYALMYHANVGAHEHHAPMAFHPNAGGHGVHPGARGCEYVRLARECDDGHGFHSTSTRRQSP